MPTYRGRSTPPDPNALPPAPPTSGQQYTNPYGVPEPTMPTPPQFDYEPQGPQGDYPYAGMEELFSVLRDRLGMDEERARAVLGHYMEQYNQGRAIEAPLIKEDQDIVSRGSLNPNDPRTYGRYAGEAIQAAHDRDLINQQLEASGLQGGELEAAKAQATQDLFRNTAASRQNAIGQARDRLYGIAHGKQTEFSPGEESGAGQAMLGYYGQKEQGEANRGLQRYGIDVNRDLQIDEGTRRWLLEKYGIDIGAAGQARGQDIQRTANQQNYELEKQRLQQQKKPGFLGGLLGTLGGIAATAFGGPAGGALFGGLSNIFRGGSGSTFSPGAAPGTTQMNTGGYATNLPQPYGR